MSEPLVPPHDGASPQSSASTPRPGPSVGQYRGARVVVLCGGPSAEREVSLRSGERVYRALRDLGYDVGKLDFSGDLLVEKDILHRLMTSKEATVFNRSLLAKDIQAITDVYYDSGYAYANITPVTAVNAEKKTIDLTFDVQKGPKGLQAANVRPIS